MNVRGIVMILRGVAQTQPETVGISATLGIVVTDFQWIMQGHQTSMEGFPEMMICRLLDQQLKLAKGLPSTLSLL